MDPLAALFAELGRLRELARLEFELCARGFRLIAGVDEAGRGSLAGPVVAGAVILPEGCVLPGLDDSKRVEADARERLDGEIRRRAVSVGVGVVEARRIDSDNILRASLEAMRLAVCALDPPPDVLLVDAVRVPAVRMPQLSVTHGDALSFRSRRAPSLPRCIAIGCSRNSGGDTPSTGSKRTRATGRPSTGKRCVSTGRARSTG